MNDKIASVYQDMKNIESMKKKVLENYHIVIHDKSISMEERWNFFVTFPKEYKNTQEHNFIPQSIKDNFPDFDWYKNLGYLPNVTINSVCFVQMLENVIKNINELKGYSNNDFYHFYRKHPECLNHLKEDFLENNLLSFTNKAANI